jgi:hypothetical protein
MTSAPTSGTSRRLGTSLFIRRGVGRWGPIVSGFLVVLLASCTTNSPGTAGYESRAATTAERMVSPVATGQLLAQLGAKGDLFGAYAKTATTGTLDEADQIQSAFNQVQPPNLRAEKLRAQIDDLLQRSTSALVDLRIAARKGDLEALGRFDRRLGRLVAELQRFENAHLQ